MGKANFHDPAEPSPINRSTPKLVRLITSSIPPTIPNLVTIGCSGSSGQWGEIYTFFVGIFSFFLLQTLHLPVNMVRYLSLIRQTTCSRAYSCIDLTLFTPTLFWGSFTLKTFNFRQIVIVCNLSAKSELQPKPMDLRSLEKAQMTSLNARNRLRRFKSSRLI